MKKVFFTVGPSQLYPTVPKHIKKALTDNILSLSHRSEAFSKIYKNTQDNLRNLLNIPQTHQIFFTASALESMERTIQNTVHKKSFHFVNGSFSREFWQISVDLKKKVERFDSPNGEGFDFNKAKIPKSTELICIVQNETSTGVAIPMDQIYELKKKYPKMLIALDVVSSIPYISIDFSVIDIVIFSVQKGFGLPAGLGVLIVNDKALEKARFIASKNLNIGSYHNFLKLYEFGTKLQTRETPNVLDIHLLGKVASDMLSTGIEKIRKDTELKAKLLYDFFDLNRKYKPFVENPFRSQTTIIVNVKGDAIKIINKFGKNGYVISSGYGKRKEDHIRIANFPAISVKSVKELLNYFS